VSVYEQERRQTEAQLRRSTEGMLKWTKAQPAASADLTSSSSSFVQKRASPPTTKPTPSGTKPRASPPGQALPRGSDGGGEGEEQEEAEEALAWETPPKHGSAKERQTRSDVRSEFLVQSGGDGAHKT